MVTVIINCPVSMSQCSATMCTVKVKIKHSIVLTEKITHWHVFYIAHCSNMSNVTTHAAVLNHGMNLMVQVFGASTPKRWLWILFTDLQHIWYTTVIVALQQMLRLLPASTSYLDQFLYISWLLYYHFISYICLILTYLLWLIVLAVVYLACLSN